MSSEQNYKELNEKIDTLDHLLCFYEFRGDGRDKRHSTLRIAEEKMKKLKKSIQRQDSLISEHAVMLGTHEKNADILCEPEMKKLKGCIDRQNSQDSLISEHDVTLETHKEIISELDMDIGILFDPDWSNPNVFYGLVSHVCKRDKFKSISDTIRMKVARRLRRNVKSLSI